MSEQDERPATSDDAASASPTVGSAAVGRQGRSGRPGRSSSPFERFFPGPAPEDPRLAARLEAFARAAERRTARQREGEQRDAWPAQREGGTAPTLPVRLSAEDLEPLAEAVREQTEVLRTLLEADIAIRDDARATAQNSRTFAVAGTVIAFLTLVATAVTVVLAFTG